MLYPNFHCEKAVWKRGFRFIAGVDEVGRGALAGPVVAGCVVFNKKIAKYNFLQNPLNSFKVSSRNLYINDSKKLSHKKREVADIWIRNNCLTWGIGEASSRDIDKLGIVKATNRAMRRAIANANIRFRNRIQYLLIDAFYIPYIRGINMPLKRLRTRKYPDNDLKISCGGCQAAIIKGDQKSFSIASASIIAKVYRDKLMINLGSRNRYKMYEWDSNKGYGTNLHKTIITKSGITCLHRRTFCDI